jgi:DNA-binding MarR family transcriptional regulator
MTAPKKEDIQALALAVLRFTRDIRQGQQAVDPVRTGILQQVAERGPVRPSELAETLEVNHSTISRQVQALEQEQLISIEADPHDQRAYRIALTQEGREHLQHLTEAGLEVFSGLVEDWDAEEVQRFVADLNRFSDVMERRGAILGKQAWSARRAHWRKRLE